MRNSLLASLQRLAQLQRSRFDRVELQQVVEDEFDESIAKLVVLKGICSELLLRTPKKIKTVNDPSILPMLIFDKDQGWGVLKSHNAKGEWIAEWFSADKHTWLELIIEDLEEYELFAINMKKKLDVSKSRIFQMVKSEIIIHKKWLIIASVAGLFILTALRLKHQWLIPLKFEQHLLAQLCHILALNKKHWLLQQY
jgi:ATP-binding cassette subfamily C protein LapB